MRNSVLTRNVLLLLSSLMMGQLAADDGGIVDEQAAAPSCPFRDEVAKGEASSDKEDVVAWGESKKKLEKAPKTPVAAKPAVVADAQSSVAVKSGDATPTGRPEVAAYNAPVVVNANSPANLYFTGAYLYWKASADYLTYGFLNNSFSPNPGAIENLLFKGKVLEPGFGYKSGFKAGMGYKFHRDRWDLYAAYTRFHQSTHSSKEVRPGGQHIAATWITLVTTVVFNEEFRSCSNRWTTHLDIADLELGRSFYCGQYLTFRPSLGLRSMWLEQKYNLLYISLVNALPFHSNNKSTSWGIGPRAALNSAWNLYGGLKVVGDLGISLLHVQDHISSRHFSSVLPSLGAPSETIYKNREHLNILKPILDLSLGLGWGRSFCQDKYAFDLQLTYDYSIYYDQGSIQLGRAPLVPPGGSAQMLVGNAGESTGNLSMQGLRAAARFDF